MKHADRWIRRFGNTGDALFVADENGRIKYWNEGAQRLTGYPEAEVLGRRCYAVLCGRRADHLWCEADCHVRRSVRRGVLPSHVSVEVRARSGRRVPVCVSFLVQEERGKKVVAHLLQDASRQDEMRQTLRGVLRLVQGLGMHRVSRPDPSEPRPARAPEPGEAGDLSRLTRREIEVLRFLTEGLVTDAIGSRLGVSPFTARNHIQHALKKMGLRTRAQAVAAALEQGLH